VFCLTDDTTLCTMCTFTVNWNRKLRYLRRQILSTIKDIVQRRRALKAIITLKLVRCKVDIQEELKLLMDYRCSLKNYLLLVPIWNLPSKRGKTEWRIHYTKMLLRCWAILEASEKYVKAKSRDSAISLDLEEIQGR